MRNIKTCTRTYAVASRNDGKKEKVDGWHKNSSCSSGGSTPIVGSSTSDDVPGWQWTYIKHHFKCKLLLQNGQLTATYGVVCPPSKGKMVHNVQ